MAINLADLITEPAPSLNPVTKSVFEPIFKAGLPPIEFTTHPGISEVPTGSNPYVNGLLNMGWRWDSSATNGDSTIIGWNVGPTFEVPLDATSLPPIKTAPQWLAALQSAANNAFN